jgi:uncharacterized repeat protein (TIGR03837 family)
LSWDILCRVVDNYGDAAVCWRLARQIAVEEGGRVRLWIDNLAALQTLVPAVSDAQRQNVGPVEVRSWKSDEPALVAPADVLVEAFGCGVPDAYARALASRSKPGVWIVLEYLSAEPWVTDHHALASLHPRYDVRRYFFFPGFIEGTGGLLLEPDLFARRDAFSSIDRAAFWRSAGHAPPAADALTVSVFGYDTPALEGFLKAWERSQRPVVAAIPAGRVLPRVLRWFGVDRVPDVPTLRRGSLEARVLPFVAQAQYDSLLWSCDCNIVRGEDSFVRAQWAARPFIWHIYPQEARAHWRKLESFLELYCRDLPADAAEAVKEVMRTWNEPAASAARAEPAWQTFTAHFDPIAKHTRAWADRLARLGGLAGNLASFCRDKLK